MPWINDYAVVRRQAQQCAQQLDLERVLDVVARVHRDHRRDSSDVPYAIHPLRVGLQLFSHDGTGIGDVPVSEVVATGFAHDVIEDAPEFSGRLGQCVSSDVLAAVALLTKPQGVDKVGYLRGKSQITDGFYDALGHTIKVARADLGIERKDLAEQAGISHSYLAAIERGQRQPSSQVLLALADALGLRSHQLLESAESRRDRNLSPSEEYPRWLTASDQPQPMRMGSAPFAPELMAPPSESFITQMERLSPTLSESDKQLLLDMARKLAG